MERNRNITLTCIAGGMAEAFYGVPPLLSEKCESLVPQDMLQVIRRFNKACR